MLQNMEVERAPVPIFEDTEGQLAFSPISTNTSNKIVQSNSMIKGRQDLSLNEAKLVRIIIMQIMANDMDFRPYIVSPGELAMLVGNTDAVNMYHNAKDICESLMGKQLEIVSTDGSWVKYNWVSMCRYNARTKKIEIKLNVDLKPFLLGLVEKGFYTQYSIDNTLSMSSVYALRIFELLQEKMKEPILPKKGVRITLQKSEIIDACMLYKKDKDKGRIILDPETRQPMERYSRISQFKEKVIETACREICEHTVYYVPYKSEYPEHPDRCVRFIKNGREIVSFDFYVNMSYRMEKIS